MTTNEFAIRYPDLLDGPFQCSALDFRIRPGRKHPDDLVLDWCTSRGWVPVTFEPVGLMFEFLYRNEDVLYPPAQQFLGGEKVVRYLRDCQKLGHRDAWRNLQWEKRNKNGLFNEPGEAA